jgi:hypothetical protein
METCLAQPTLQSFAFIPWLARGLMNSSQRPSEIPAMMKNQTHRQSVSAVFKHPSRLVTWDSEPPLRKLHTSEPVEVLRSRNDDAVELQRPDERVGERKIGRGGRNPPDR